MSSEPAATRIDFLSGLKDIRKVPILILGLFLITFPVRISKSIRDFAKKVSLHEYLYYICERLHLLAFLPRIESTLFQIPGAYEGELATFLVNTKGDLFVDVGANVGRYTVLLGKNYREVITIEPEPLTFHYLKANVSYAKLTNVQFLQCAVSNKDGFTDLHLSISAESHSIINDYQSGHRLPGTDKKVGELTGEKIRVKTQTLATILKDRTADLVKVDVEGAEWYVLEGAQSVVNQVKSWVVELHDWHKEGNKEELEVWFTKRGYQCSWLDCNHIFAVQK